MICGNSEGLARYERQCESDDRIREILLERGADIAEDARKELEYICAQSKLLLEKTTELEKDKIWNTILNDYNFADFAAMSADDLIEKYKQQYVDDNFDGYEHLQY